MRPLYHPAAGDITLEGILYALSDPVRAGILATIAAETSPCTCSRFLQQQARTVPKSTLSQHFKILREAGLIRSVRKGVEMHSTIRCDDLRARFGTLVESILQAHMAEAKSRARKRA